MDATSNKNTAKSENEPYKFHHYSYILRIWKTDEGTFKGYVINPLTHQTYPVENITKPIASVDPPVSKGVVLEPLGCRLGVWDPGNADEEKH